MTTTPKAWPPGVTLRSEAPPEAAPIKVFIVVIETGHCDDVEQKIGACYTNEYLAVEEVERLRASHWDTDAHLVEREIPFPKCAIVQVPEAAPISTCPRRAGKTREDFRAMLLGAGYSKFRAEVAVQEIFDTDLLSML